MKLLWTARAWGDYLRWQDADQEVRKKINELIRDTTRHPFSGTGKPEPLRGEYQGLWSRRITLDHRLVYRVFGRGDDQTLEIVTCRYHYQK